MKKIIFVFTITPFIIGAIFTYYNAHSLKILKAQNNVSGTNMNPGIIRDEYSNTDHSSAKY